MPDSLPLIYLARHGETEWTISHQHTGRTDIPLTERGERNARALGERLRGLSFSKVFTSSLTRATYTAKLAGFQSSAEPDDDLMEWDYGRYDGKTSAQIREDDPNWNLFRDGCPGGESVEAVSARADRVIARLRAIDGSVLLFGHGHFFRVLTARWLGLTAAGGRLFYLGTAALSILGYEHSRDEPVIRLWNDDRHVSA